MPPIRITEIRSMWSYPYSSCQTQTHYLIVHNCPWCSCQTVEKISWVPVNRIALAGQLYIRDMLAKKA